MRQQPTVYEVAKRAGVSTASVSRVLAGNDRVLPETRQRVLAAVADLGYVPSGAARDLAARRTGVLGLCFPDLAGDDDGADGDAMYWFDEVIRGMERAARRRGYAVLIAASHASDDVDLVTMVGGRCDGLVVLARTVPAPVLERIAQRIPVVMLAGRHDRDELDHLLDHLVVANEDGAHEVTMHLVDVHGYGDLTFLAGPDSPDSNARFEGFRKALTARGLPAPEQPEFAGDFTTAGGERAVAQMLATGRRPRTLVCANDQMAIGAIAALSRAGLRVPEDVAVTGFDGVMVGRFLQPSLTTVVQPMRRLGETAVAMLEERLTGAGRPAKVVELPVRVELHESCGCRR